MEPITQRVAAIVTLQKPKKTEPKEVDPTSKLLNELHESISEEDSSAALDHLYTLTKLLNLEDEVSFEIPSEP